MKGRSKAAAMPASSILAMHNEMVDVSGHNTHHPTDANPDVVTNPFALPSDEQIFRMREEERDKKAKDKSKLQSMKVWEKTTSTSRMGRTRRIREGDIPMTDAVTSKAAKQTRGIVTAATAAISTDRRREKENMADFIAKKREMFLVQMSLDTKREEIQKLEHKAHMKEEALKKSELMLEEDAIRFDTFLKENDTSAYHAVAAAEEQAKLKTARVHEIKKLRHAISVVSGEQSKCKDALDDCDRYRDFLEMLTPSEWTAEQWEIKRQRQEQRRRAKHASKLTDWESKHAELERIEARKDEEERKKALKEGRKFKPRDIRKLVSSMLPSAPTLEGENLESSGTEIPMYFQKPQQLLDVFTTLEEDNLFLIRHCQETEQQLEELKQAYDETDSVMGRQTAALAETISSLKAQIDKEEAKASALRTRVNKAEGDDPQQRLLNALESRVREVYENCGFDVTAKPSTLSMLSDLEGKLEHLLRAIAAMDEEYVSKKEKDKERERRDRMREERILLQKRQYDLRLQKSMERSQAPVKKKTGKQVMFRSAPIKRRVKKEVRDPKKEQEAADMVFLT